MRRYSRTTLLVGMLLGAALVLASTANAQRSFTSVSSFGDSYADTGSAPGGVFGGNCPPVFPTCRFSNGTNFADTLASTYGLPGVTNYAFGGAQTDDNNVVAGPGFGFANELDTLVASGNRFGPKDLIALSIGGNDQALFNSNTLAEINALAVSSAANAVAGVNVLVDQGARTITWVSPGNPVHFPAPFGDPALTPEQRTEWARTYYQQIQEGLAPLAESGRVRINLFDYETLQANVVADPGKYGFASAGSCLASLGVPDCLAATPDVQNSFFYWDTIHPTSAGFALIAQYMAYQLGQTEAVAAQADLAGIVQQGFTDAIADRIEERRLGGPEVSWFIHGDFGWGERAERANAVGFDYERSGVVAGVDMHPTQNSTIGAIVGYTDADASLDAPFGNVDLSTYSLGVFGSMTASNVFVDASAAYHIHDVGIFRPGVIDPVFGNTDGSGVNASVKAGYIINNTPTFRWGPIVGLDYAHVDVSGYTETGDPLLTLTVGEQEFDSLIGSAGVKFWHDAKYGDTLVQAWVELTANHAFLGTDRSVVTALTSAPLLPYAVPIGGEESTFGKVSGGVSIELSPGLLLQGNATAAFGQDGDHDLSLKVGLRGKF